jgi:peptidoglycan-N-acetylglucosamine deacetylase
VDAGWVERALADLAARSWTLIVLHDGVPDTPALLPRFLDRLRDEGHELVQEFPDDCVPIQRGVVRAAIDGYVTDARA